METEKKRKEESFSLRRLLEIDPAVHRLIAVIGAGGKTSLIYHLARELKDMGYTAAVTTTTHMFKEGMFGFTPLGQEIRGEKVKGFAPEIPEKMLEQYDVVLVEADGSKRLPFKIPAAHEPVLPVGADLVIGVAGASAMGQTFSKACHRFELAEIHWNLQQAAEEKITAEHILEGLCADWGQKKQVDCEYRYVINQSDLLSAEALEEIRRISGKYRERGCVLSIREKRGTILGI